VYAEIAGMLFYLSLISHVLFLYCLGYYVGVLCHSVDRLADPLICCHQKPIAYDFLGRFSIENLYLGFARYLEHHNAIQ
jgi:hypothetical protein